MLNRVRKNVTKAVLSFSCVKVNCTDVAIGLTNNNEISVATFSLSVGNCNTIISGM